jgi:hypothetical protein
MTDWSDITPEFWDLITMTGAMNIRLERIWNSSECVLNESSEKIYSVIQNYID